MLKLISQPALLFEILVTGSWAKCGHRLSTEVANDRFAAIDPRQGYPMSGRGLWNRRE